MLRGKGRILPHVRGGFYIYVCRDVAKDSTFPFKPPEDIIVSIEGKRLLIEKPNKSNKQG